MNLCKYKDIFGKPNEGLHSYRLFDIAIVDVILTIMAAYYISKYLNYNFYLICFYLFIIGIYVHRFFCVKTKIDKILFD